MPSYSPEFREKVHQAYCLGRHVSVDAVSAEFGVSPRLVWSWINKYGWREDREKVAELAKTKRIEDIAKEREKLDRVYLGLWTRFLSAAREMIDIVIGQKDAKGLAALSTVVRRAQDGHRIVLGIERDEQRPVVSEDRLLELSDEELEKEIDRLRHEVLAEADRGQAASTASRKAAAAGS